jgi:hypothetical protein
MCPSNRNRGPVGGRVIENDENNNKVDSGQWAEHSQPAAAAQPHPLPPPKTYCWCLPGGCVIEFFPDETNKGWFADHVTPDDSRCLIIRNVPREEAERAALEWLERYERAQQRLREHLRAKDSWDDF